MKANYTDYMKLFNKLYLGVPLTEIKLSDNALQIARYLKDGGASELMKRIGIGLKQYVTVGKPIKTELYYISGCNAGRALTIDEIRHIGILLLIYWKEIV